MKIIKDERQLKKKIDRIKLGGPNQLHVISDFDRTLTKAFTMNGEKMMGSYEVIRAGNYLSPEYVKKAYSLFDIYYPIVVEPQLG